MKITLRQSWESMIEGCTDEQIEAMDVAATQRAFAVELEAAVRRDYPNAEVSAWVGSEYFRYGTVIEGVDDLKREMTQAHIETIADVVYGGGTFWVDKCPTR